MRSLILGATGFIGGQIARAARRASVEVHGLRRSPGSVGAVGDLDLIWHDGDLADPASLRAAMHDCDVVYHAAAYYPYLERDVATAIHTATTEIRAVVEAARDARVGRVVYTSSLATIGSPPPGSARLADERDHYVPGSTRNAYFEAKWVMEQEALLAAQTGLEVVVLIPTTVFGPGDVKPATGQILRDLARGRFPISVHALTNIVDVREVAEAHLSAAHSGHSGQRYIIGGHNLDIAEALRQAAEAGGVRPPLAVLPHGLAVGLLRRVDGLPLPIPQTVRALPYWQPLNCDRGWRTFDIKPRPFAQTAGDAIAWFREHGYV